jgi:hypothetical protein
LHDLGKIAGKHVGENGSALDQAGISETGFFARELVPVDQDDLSPALLQVQGGADANHSSTQYENIGLQFRHPCSPLNPAAAALRQALISYDGRNSQTD